MQGCDPDDDLVARVASGDRGAIRAMVARKLPRILGLASRILSDRHEAEDVVQEAFIRIWRQAPSWRRGQAKFDTWLHRVVLNLCTDRLRKRREHYVAELPETEDPGGRPDAGVLETHRRESVEAALAALPQRQREAIILQYFQELSNIEAAAAMEISVEALESLLSRARRRLREILSDEMD